MSYPSMTKAEVRRASRLLHAKGRKLPKVGYCIELQGRPPASTYSRVMVCRDPRGYFLTGRWDSFERRAAFDGRKRRR